MKDYMIIILAVVLAIIGVSPYLFIFNDGISSNADDWQTFGSYGSAIFSLIAIIMTSMIFCKQNRIEKQNNYNNFCMNFISCHQQLYDRIGSDTFRDMSKFFERSLNISNCGHLAPENIKAIYEQFMKYTYKSMNIRNYFKFIYYEIDYIANNFKDKKSKKDGIEMIRSYMSNHELFCYFINQIQYYNETRKDEIKQYGTIIKEHNFFNEMFAYSVYDDIANKIDKKIVEIFVTKK